MIRKLVFTATNRPYYLQPSIESWNAVRGLGTWDVEFFIEPTPVQDQMRDVAFQLNARSVVVGINKQRLGVLVNPWHAMETAFRGGAEFVILAEDDVAVSSDILEYFEWASEKYEDDPEILCVNAFSKMGGAPNFVMKSQQFSPLIWGTWRDRWYSTLRNSWDKDYSSGNPDGSEAGWDWNINRILQKNWEFVIKPQQSRSDHLGEWGGTHMTPDLYDDSRGADFVQIRGQEPYYLVF
jgi:hypothetical protein